MDESGIGCPNCGFKIASGLIPASPTSSFSCPRCHKELTTVTPDQTAIILFSWLLALGGCVVFGLKGLGFLLGAAGIGAATYFSCMFVRGVIAAPRLRPSPPKH